MLAKDILLEHCKLCVGEDIIRPTKDYDYICFDCDYFTHTKQGMWRHISKHTGDKPYKCKICSYKSIRSYDVKKHEQTTHSSETVKTEKKKSVSVKHDKIAKTKEKALSLFLLSSASSQVGDP